VERKLRKKSFGRRGGEKKKGESYARRASSQKKILSAKESAGDGEQKRSEAFDGSLGGG